MSSALFWSLLLVIVLVKGLFLCLAGWLLFLYLWLVQVWDVVGNGFIVALVFFFFVLGVHFIFFFFSFMFWSEAESVSKPFSLLSLVSKEMG